MDFGDRFVAATVDKNQCFANIQKSYISCAPTIIQTRRYSSTALCTLVPPLQNLLQNLWIMDSPNKPAGAPPEKKEKKGEKCIFFLFSQKKHMIEIYYTTLCALPFFISFLSCLGHARRFDVIFFVGFGAHFFCIFVEETAFLIRSSTLCARFQYHLELRIFFPSTSKRLLLSPPL
jgi:hypothetical protein